MFANAEINEVRQQIENAANAGGNFARFTFKGTPAQLVVALSELYDTVELSDDNRSAIITNEAGEFCNVSCNGYVTRYAA